MTLAFYGVEGLSKGYLNKPIDIGHFEKGLQFLERHPSVSKDHIGVLGTSKGGDLALSMAAYLPQVKAVCILNGSITVTGVSSFYNEHQTDAVLPDLDRLRLREDGRNIQ